jgi:hypothetical protein
MRESFGDRNPHLVGEWHPTKNGDITPFDVAYGTRKKYWFICPVKKHEYESSLNNRSNGNNCACCHGKQVCVGNCFATLFPNIAKEWHPTKNGSLTAFELTSNSHKMIWFKCPPRGHEYQASLHNRAKGRHCPYCSGHRTCIDNCLATLRPDIAKEWHPSKNSNLTPFDVTAASSKKVWFVCPRKGHEYQSSIDNRTVLRQCCPFCVGKKVCADNCLATLFPDVAKEWHPTKNGKFTPLDFTAFSGRKAWFMCPSKEHEYQTRISHRAEGSGCPFCKESRGEKQIANFLAELRINYKRQAKFSKCKNKRLLPFDFIIFPRGRNPGIIEYHGEQHYLSIKWFGGMKKLAAVQDADAIKRQFCIDKKLTMLVIPYWDFSRIEELIKDFIVSLPHQEVNNPFSKSPRQR